MFKKALLVSAMSLSVTYSYGADIGETTINSVVKTVGISGVSDPIVITGVPSSNEADSGAVSVSNVTSSTFDISFKEWEYLDGIHSDETVPYAVWEAGRVEKADGTVWEVGSFDQAAKSKRVEFLQPFDGVPKLFITGQTSNGDTYVVRAKSVTSYGFVSVAQFFEASKNKSFDEKVGYLAIYSSEEEGQLDNGLPYDLQWKKSDNVSGKPVVNFAGKTVTLEEDSSKDTEVAHVSEVLSMMSINGNLFASDSSLYGSDPMSLRQEPEKLEFLSSCKALIDNDSTLPSGYYSIDPDGVGGIAEFTTYCNMEFKGGGWTLVSKRRSSIGDPTDAITSDSVSQYLRDSQWIELRGQASELLAVQDVESDIPTKYATGDISTLLAANCVPLGDSLSQVKLIHHESSGCSGNGSDYSGLGSTKNNMVSFLWGYNKSLWSHNPASNYHSSSENIDIYVR
ncbi:hypothetical protein GV054_17315 [Marinomonas mediterranea]|jgi:Fibrinogen beta and gamma chains, C-terminal globular domain.|uniref:Fibrinogen C-terminal domain-containing protein n=1 Tax=Marinomonas mediterranea (strain ATCC 700492 / JCM 21426 / NBRC 103028 / MMB-1) TaxID=717774 RepID=F2JTN0_MARM1|nr:fibrinogen-like YCDxxxxGGGW domain-containing protein [Marinomonas mediterranea]ADZ92650.1 hypothetical protein Marme_3434 [Marinomonas mediterranea MMB-1]WCN14638.1 hypothetical protein GV054_17315 [Marinomonas mediterranea]WCN18685.1 hypothetical protein GV053_17380 [Marinomonas mediterranea MMB-1]